MRAPLLFARTRPSPRGEHVRGGDRTGGGQQRRRLRRPRPPNRVEPLPLLSNVGPNRRGYRRDVRGPGVRRGDRGEVRRGVGPPRPIARPPARPVVVRHRVHGVVQGDDDFNGGGGVEDFVRFSFRLVATRHLMRFAETAHRRDGRRERVGHVASVAAIRVAAFLTSSPSPASSSSLFERRLRVSQRMNDIRRHLILRRTTERPERPRCAECSVPAHSATSRPNAPTASVRRPPRCAPVASAEHGGAEPRARHRG